MRVLIIGGTRFIGPPVVERLAAGGHGVTIFHRGMSEHDTPAGRRPAWRTCNGDVASSMGFARTTSASHPMSCSTWLPRAVNHSPYATVLLRRRCGLSRLRHTPSCILDQSWMRDQ